MAEDSKDDSVATDDDSDYTGADGNHSLNNVVNLTPIFDFYFHVKTPWKRHVSLPTTRHRSELAYVLVELDRCELAQHLTSGAGSRSFDGQYYGFARHSVSGFMMIIMNEVHNE